MLTRSVQVVLKSRAIGPLVVTALLLVACGGGGGGSASVPPALVARDWGTALLIETDDAGGTYAPQVAVDTAGNAIAVWEQSDGTHSNILSNRYTAGPGWGTPVAIDSVAGDAYGAQLAVDAAGNAIAVWYQAGGAGVSNIYANRYDAAVGAWGAAELIENAVGDAYEPQIAFDAAGNAIAVWRQLIGTQYRIRAARFAYDAITRTGLWEAPVNIDSVTGDAYSPQIAFDAAGNAIVVWSQSDGTRDNIWANRYTAGTGWGTAALIETDNAGYAYDSQIGFDASGNAIAVWRQFDGTRDSIWANRYDAGSGWGTAALIETDNTSNAFDPQIAFDNAGNAIAVWDQGDGTRFNIWANRYTAGAGWGTPALIETDNGDASHPQIAFDVNGNALAVWRQFDGTRYSIWANRYVAGSGWGTAALIETDNAGNAGNPQIAVDAGGNALAVWWQDDGTRYNIWANSYR